MRELKKEETEESRKQGVEHMARQSSFNNEMKVREYVSFHSYSVYVQNKFLEVESLVWRKYEF